MIREAITAETIREIFTNPEKVKAEFASRKPKGEFTPEILNNLIGGFLKEDSREDFGGPEDPIITEIRRSFEVKP